MTLWAHHLLCLIIPERQKLLETRTPSNNQALCHEGLYRVTTNNLNCNWKPTGSSAARQAELTRWAWNAHYSLYWCIWNDCSFHMVFNDSPCRVPYQCMNDHQIDLFVGQLNNRISELDEPVGKSPPAYSFLSHFSSTWKSRRIPLNGEVQSLPGLQVKTIPNLEIQNSPSPAQCSQN